MTAMEPQVPAAWRPPPWLRRLRVVAVEQRALANDARTPEERFRLACTLTSFALARLREQAERRGCPVDDLLRLYEQATDRLRARA